ncbi:unnamed protein product [Notodromas monacha]|uniref:Uncharacterized protein n=1 Tax=Notodromas monacha TaxID=399045 RepID=A0A7R9BIP1_9CRUS|nr:unnamed protein product [Notodromas monacha]CAG0915342.1 unnamed protein product [Notodromas monacha]
MMRMCQTCCCCFSLKSGTQCIGLFCFVLSTINLSSSLYQILTKVHTSSLALKSLLVGYCVLYASFIVLSIGVIYGAQARKAVFPVLWSLCALSIAGLETAHIALILRSQKQKQQQQPTGDTDVDVDDEGQRLAIVASTCHALVMTYFAFVVCNAALEIRRDPVKVEQTKSPPDEKNGASHDDDDDDEAYQFNSNAEKGTEVTTAI